MYKNYPKLINKFNKMLFEYSTSFLVERDKLILKLIWEYKGPKIDKIVLKGINKVGGLALQDFKTYKAIVMVVLIHR